MDERNMIGATAVTVGIVLVLTLILLLLAQLYCSIFLRQRRLHHPSAAANNTPQHPPHPSDLRTFYAQGVLRAPRSFLFPEYDDLEASQYSSSHQMMMMMYNISNPMYDEEAGVMGMRKLEDGGYSGGTPPLTPMKKLPPEYPTHTNSINGAISSSLSPSPSTSPSW